MNPKTVKPLATSKFIFSTPEEKQIEEKERDGGLSSRVPLKEEVLRSLSMSFLSTRLSSTAKT